MILYFSTGTLSKEAGLRQSISIILEIQNKPVCCWNGATGVEFPVDLLEQLLDLSCRDEDEGMCADMRWNGEVVSGLSGFCIMIMGWIETYKSHGLFQNFPPSKNSLATSWERSSCMNLYGNLETANAGQKEPDIFTLVA